MNEEGRRCCAGVVGVERYPVFIFFISSVGGFFLNTSIFLFVLAVSRRQPTVGGPGKKQKEDIVLMVVRARERASVSCIFPVRCLDQRWLRMYFVACCFSSSCFEKPAQNQPRLVGNMMQVFVLRVYSADNVCVLSSL